MKIFLILLPNNLLDHLIVYDDISNLINLFPFLFKWHWNGAHFPKSAKLTLIFPKRKTEAPSPKMVFWPWYVLTDRCSYFTGLNTCIIDLKHILYIYNNNNEEIRCLMFGLFCNLFFMPPFEEEGVYCFANVSLLVGRLVDQMVSANYLKYHLSQCLHISHVDWT